MPLAWLRRWLSLESGVSYAFAGLQVLGISPEFAHTQRLDLRGRTLRSFGWPQAARAVIERAESAARGVVSPAHSRLRSAKATKAGTNGIPDRRVIHRWCRKVGDVSR